MDGLELCVRQSHAHERGQGIISVQKTLELGQGAGHLVRRRRDEACLVQGATSGANPVLARPQFSGPKLAATHPPHQFGMDLPDEPHGDRQFSQAGQPVVHRPHVVNHLAHIRRRIRIVEARLGSQQVL